MPSATVPFPEPAAREFKRKVWLVWVGLCLLSLAVNARAILQVRFPDPDDLLRLLQVRDWIAGQSWFDVHQYRINPPSGAAMHWTRLIDPPIAAIIMLLRRFVGQDSAEIAALVIVPLVTMGFVIALVARFARRLYGSELALLTCLIVALSIPVLHQLRPLRIDHHGWQIVMALIALNALFARNARTGGAIAGTALAFWLAISIEGLPLAAAFMAIFAMRWLRDPQQGDWLASGLAALAAGSTVFWIADHGWQGMWSPLCDVVSGAHLVMLGVFAAGCLLATRLKLDQLWQRCAALALSGAAGLGAFVALAPNCAGFDAFSALDPVVRDFWYVHVYEGLPLWDQPIDDAVRLLCLPLIALYALKQLLREEEQAKRLLWREYTMIVAAALAVAILVERASAVAAVFAAPAAAWQVEQWLKKARVLKSPLARIAATLAAFMVLVPSVPVSAALRLAQPQQAKLESKVALDTQCQLASNLRALDALPPATILSTLDTGPWLLYASHHRIVASGHHRSSAAMRDVIDAFRGSADQAHAIVLRRGVSYIAFCQGLAEPITYSHEYPNGLMAQLTRGQVPAWLEPIRIEGAKGLLVFRVR